MPKEGGGVPVWECRLGLGNGPTSSLGPQLLLGTAGLVTADCPAGSKSAQKSWPPRVPQLCSSCGGSGQGRQDQG